MALTTFVVDTVLFYEVDEVLDLFGDNAFVSKQYFPEGKKCLELDGSCLVLQYLVLLLLLFLLRFEIVRFFG